MRAAFAPIASCTARSLAPFVWHFTCSSVPRTADDGEVEDMMAVVVAHRYCRGKLSRARRRRVRWDLLAWLRRPHAWPPDSPFSRHPLAA